MAFTAHKNKNATAIREATLLAQQGKVQAALNQMLVHLKKNSGDIELFNFTATLASQMQDWITAEAHFKKTLALNPGDQYALYNLSKVYKLSSRNLDAINLLGRLIEIAPKNTAALNEIGALLVSQGYLEPAIRALQTATALDPHFAMAQKNLYFALYTQGQYAEAAIVAKQALTCIDEEQRWNVRADLVIFLWKNQAFAEARETAETLISDLEQRGLPEQKIALINALTNYGLVLMELDEAEAAEFQFRRVIALAPEMLVAYINMGKLKAYQENFQEAIGWFEQASTIDPEHPELHSHLAVFLRDAGRPDLALPHHMSALTTSPANSENRYYLGITLFALGQLKEAYSYWEMRWSRAEGGSKSNLPIPEWTGAPDKGKSLLVYREQGIGDELLFANCLPDVTQHFERVVYVCHSKLTSLLTRSFPKIEFRSGDYKFLPEDISSFEWQIPIGSLPSIFRPEVQSFPRTPQLLTPAPDIVDSFRQRLLPMRQSLVIGIAWRSGLLSLHRRLIYPYLQFWHALFSIQGITWLNLQYGDVTDELQKAQEQFGVSILNFADVDHFNDLDTSAALMKACDVVIGPETSTTLISAAVGTPTFRLSTGCDHFRLGTDHYPWFPCITPIPRQFGESWEEPIQRVAQIIRTLVDEISQAPKKT